MSDTSPQDVLGADPAVIQRIVDERLAAERSKGKRHLLAVAQYLLARGSEASSYAGLSTILALAGWNLPPEYYAQTVQLLAGVCGLLALTLKDWGAKQ